MQCYNDCYNTLKCGGRKSRCKQVKREKSQAGLKSKKVGRRAARMQRRQIDRRTGRTKHIVQLAPLLGIEIEPSPE